MEKSRSRSRETTASTAHLSGRGAKKGELSSQQPELGASDQRGELTAIGHQYSVGTIQLAVQQIICSGSSLRGVEKTFELYKQEEDNARPSNSRLRKWLGRIGLYELQRKKEYRTDWIFIIDLTLELGCAKSLVVLGVSQQHLIEQVLPWQRGLEHRDVEILAVEVMQSTKGELIHQKLEELTPQVGQPVQMLCDHGSDLKKGIHLYQQNHPEVIYTYDVTHAMALLLKHELVADERYQSFVKLCHQCRQQLQRARTVFFIAEERNDLNAVTSMSRSSLIGL